MRSLLSFSAAFTQDFEAGMSAVRQACGRESLNRFIS